MTVYFRQSIFCYIFAEFRGFMFVDFKTIKFKNVLSYGNNFTTLDFHKGLNLIKAQNRKW